MSEHFDDMAAYHIFVILYISHYCVTVITFFGGNSFIDLYSLFFYFLTALVTHCWLRNHSKLSALN